MGYQLFEKKYSRATNVPRVTIRTLGVISLNIAAQELLKNPEAVQLYFDPEKGHMALAPCKLETPNSYRVKGNGRQGSNRLVACAAFCNYHGIDLSLTRKYDAHDDGGWLVIDVSEHVTRRTPFNSPPPIQRVPHRCANRERCVGKDEDTDIPAALSARYPYRTCPDCRRKAGLEVAAS